MPYTTNASHTARSIGANVLIGILALICTVAHAQSSDASTEISIARRVDAASVDQNAPAALALDNFWFPDRAPNSQRPDFPDAPQDWITNSTTLSLAKIEGGTSQPRRSERDAAWMDPDPIVKQRSDATGEGHAALTSALARTAGKAESHSPSELWMPRRPYGPESMTGALEPRRPGFDPGAFADGVAPPDGSAGYIPSVITVCAVLLFLFALSGLSTVRRVDKPRTILPKARPKPAGLQQSNQDGRRKN
jgi:hypothetical protein